MDLSLTEGLKGSHVSLMDVDEHRLEMIRRFTTRLSDELNAGLQLTATPDRERALEGADFVSEHRAGGRSRLDRNRRALGGKHGYY